MTTRNNCDLVLNEVTSLLADRMRNQFGARDRFLRVYLISVNPWSIFFSINMKNYHLREENTLITHPVLILIHVPSGISLPDFPPRSESIQYGIYITLYMFPLSSPVSYLQCELDFIHAILLKKGAPEMTDVLSKFYNKSIAVFFYWKSSVFLITQVKHVIYETFELLFYLFFLVSL